MKLTKSQVNKKYKDKYISFLSTYDYSTKQHYYEVMKVYKEIHEDTTLGQDVGTPLEFNR